MSIFTIILYLFLLGDYPQAEGRDTGCCDCRVGLGQRSAHGGPSEHAPRRSSRPLWPTQHWQSDNLHQWPEPGRSSPGLLSVAYQGKWLILSETK